MSGERIRVWVTRFPDRAALQLQWIDPATKRKKTVSAKTDDDAKAEQARADKEYELNHGLSAEPSRIRWDAFRELFEGEYVPPLREETRKNYRTTLDLFEGIAKPVQLSGINERTISTFAAGLRKRKGNLGKLQSPGTVKIRLQFLHTALEWAASQKLLAACPIFPFVKVPKRKPQPVPEASYEALIRAAGDNRQMCVYLQCAWLAGTRLREAMELRRIATDEYPWVDMAGNRIWFPAGFVKADEDQWVPLDPILKKAIQTLPARQDGKVFHFVEERSGKVVSAIAICHRITDLATIAGVSLTYRSLRRGFGCRYAGKVPAQVLQKLMRHSNISVTMEYYANVDEAVEKAILGDGNTYGNTTENSMITTPPQNDASGEPERLSA